MNHDEARALLDAYFDQELDASAALAMEMHVRECEACNRFLAERRALRARIQAAPLRHDLPPALESRIRSKVLRRTARGHWAAAWPSAIAAGLVLAVAGFFVGRSVQRAPDLRDEVVSAHVRAMLSGRPIDVLSSDHHTVKPWLSSRLPYSPPVPEPSGVTLMGARIDYLGHTRVAALVYQHGKHEVSVYVWPRGALGALSSAGQPVQTSAEGYHLAQIQVGSFTAEMVSDMSSGELAAFAQQWRASATEH